MKALFGAGVIVAGMALFPASGFCQQNAPIAFDQGSALVAPEISRASRAPVHLELQEPADKPEDQMSKSGFFLGVIGMLAGAAIGSQIGQNTCPPRAEDNDCVSHHAYTGALIAGSVMVPLGVHLGNRTPRNLALSLGVSALTGAASYFGFRSVPGAPIAMAPFVAAPLQVVTSVKIERSK